MGKVKLVDYKTGKCNECISTSSKLYVALSINIDGLAGQHDPPAKRFEVAREKRKGC